MTTTPRQPGQPSQPRLRRYAAGLAAAGLLSTPLLFTATGSAAAETPAERCQRQTAEYNAAMETAWRAAHPGQEPIGNEWPPFVCHDIPTPTPPPGGGNGGAHPAPERTHQYEGFNRPDSEYQQDMDLGGLGGPRTGLADRMNSRGDDTAGAGGAPRASDTARSNVPRVVPWETTVTDDNGDSRQVRVVDTPDGPAVVADDGTATGEVLTTDTDSGVTSTTRRDGLEGRQLTDPTTNGRADRDDTDDTSSATSTSAAVPAGTPGDHAANGSNGTGGDGDRGGSGGDLPVGPLGAGGATAGGVGALLAQRAARGRRRDGAHRGDINWGNGREQSLILLEGPDSPREHSFDMDVPAGGQMVKNPDGSVDVLDADGNVVEHVKAPWAFDALGRPVETYYEVDNDNGTLVQVVDPDRTTLLPILADPDKKRTVPGGWSETSTSEHSLDSARASSIIPDYPAGVDLSDYGRRSDEANIPGSPTRESPADHVRTVAASAIAYQRNNGNPTAADIQSHYMNNSGETYNLDQSTVDSFLSSEEVKYEDVTAPAYLLAYDRETAIEEAIQVAQKENRPVKYTYVSPWQVTASGVNDGVLSLGRFSLSSTTEVLVEPQDDGSYRVSYSQVPHIFDVTDYEHSSETGPIKGQVQQGAINNLREAEELGIGKPFEVHGTGSPIEGDLDVGKKK